MDFRPAEGWTERTDGRLEFVKHDCTVFDRAPERTGYQAFFIGRHGIGPGSWTRWTYKKTEDKA